MHYIWNSDLKRTNSSTFCSVLLTHHHGKTAEEEQPFSQAV